MNISLSRDSYNLHSTRLGIMSCDLRRKVSDVMFFYDLQNGNVDSPVLLSLVGFHKSQINFRVNKLFYVPFFYH